MLSCTAVYLPDSIDFAIAHRITGLGQHCFAQPSPLQLLLPFIQVHLTLQLVHGLQLLPLSFIHVIITFCIPSSGRLAPLGAARDWLIQLLIIVCCSALLRR